MLNTPMPLNIFLKSVLHFCIFLLPFAAAHYVIEKADITKPHEPLKVIIGLIAYVISKTTYFALLYYTAAKNNLVFQINIHTFSKPLWYHLISIVACLLLLPSQTCLEELLFRGYLAEYPAIPSFIISVFLFTLPHIGNPEFWVIGPIPYILQGCIYGIPVYLTGSVDYGWGAHFIHNFILCAIFSPIVTVLPGMSIFAFSIASTISPQFTLLTNILECILFATICLCADQLIKYCDKPTKADQLPKKPADNRNYKAVRQASSFVCNSLPSCLTTCVT